MLHSISLKFSPSARRYRPARLVDTHRRKIALASVFVVAGAPVGCAAIYKASRSLEGMSLERLRHLADPSTAPVIQIAAPDQIALDERRRLRFDGPGQIEAVAKFRVQAVVLSTERYWFDQLSTWCPVDLALGWGLLGTDVIRNSINWSQWRRWYTFKFGRESGIAMSSSAVAKLSANMHIVPASRQIRNAAFDLQAGDEVELQGYLIQIRGDDGKIVARSSVSRDDIGGGACEIVYVTYLSDPRRGVVAEMDRRLFEARRSIHAAG